MSPIVCLLVFAAGCATIDDYKPAPLPRPSPARASREPARPRTPTPTALPSVVTLKQAIEEALREAPDLHAAAETVVQSRADLLTASVVPNPQLTVDGTTQSFPWDRWNAVATGGPPETDVFVTQPLDAVLFGKRSAAMESARRQVDVAGADLAFVRLRRAADVASTFFDVLEARAFLALLRTDTESLRRVESLTRRRVELGGAPAIDLDRARLAIAVSAQDVRAGELALAGALETLRALMGRGRDGAPVDVAGALAVPEPLEVPDLETLVAAAEASRPDLISLTRQVDKADADVATAKRTALPALSLQLGYSFQRQQVSLDAKDASSWDFLVTASIPIFDRNQGNIAKSESQGRQARRALEAARVSLRSEVAQALVALRSARAAVLADDPAQLEAARAVRDRTEAGYQAGGRTLLDLLDAERAYRDALRLHTHIQSMYWHALYRLNAAMGEPLMR